MVATVAGARPASGGMMIAAGSPEELVALAVGVSVADADKVALADTTTMGGTEGDTLREGYGDCEAPGAIRHSVTMSRLVKSMVPFTGVSS